MPPLRSHGSRRDNKSRRLSTSSSHHPRGHGINAVGSMSTSRDSSLELDHPHSSRGRGLDLDDMDVDDEELEGENDREKDEDGEEEYEAEGEEVRSPRRSIIMTQGRCCQSAFEQGLVAIRRVGLCSPPISSPSLVMDPSSSSAASSATAVAAVMSHGASTPSISPTTVSNRAIAMDGTGENMSLSLSNQKVTTVEMKHL